MRGFILAGLLILCISISKAQNDSIHFDFHFAYDKDNLQLNRYYPLNENDSIEINTLKFYISNIALLLKDETVWKETNSFHLIDAEVKRSTQLDLIVNNGLRYDKISFNLGIDSLTNVSGVMGADLDPSNNMYWTWQSGYINFKLEGRSNLCLARKNEFKFHLGGYQFPYNSLQRVDVSIAQQDSIQIHLDLKEIITGLKFGELDHIMSPASSAVEMSSDIANKFLLRFP